MLKSMDELRGFENADNYHKNVIIITKHKQSPFLRMFENMKPLKPLCIILYCIILYVDYMYLHAVNYV